MHPRAGPGRWRDFRAQRHGGPLPEDVIRFFGHALHFAQQGEQHDAAKVLKGFGAADVIEVVESDSHGTYRAVYTVRFLEAVYVLHVFQKKSKKGIEAPKPDMDLIRDRLKAATEAAQELRNEKARRKKN
ncbi:type II toxin-antitoxin system RelE/ParE family toxin [Bordetella sp. 2513F-2]